jgi:hypothetical protein
VQTGFGTQALDFLLAIRGRFVAIETKAPGKKLTPLQEGTKAAIEAAGGIVLVVWDESSLAIAMKIILALEFTPSVQESLDDCIAISRKVSGNAEFWACRHGTPEAERAYEKHDRTFELAQTPDAATGGDHGAPGAKPQRRSKPRSRVEDQ